MGLQLKNVVKRYLSPEGQADTIIDVDELTIANGQQVALVGSSGSGKTTLLHLMAGILTPDSGQILLETEQGQIDLAKLSEGARDAARGRYIGYVFQTHHLLPGFTALENVLLGMSFTGKKADPKWAKHLLEEVGLQNRLNYRPAKLSVGQQQRVAVARALAARPRVVLADEPTGALDPSTAMQTIGLIQRLCQEVSAALVVVTHDMDIAGTFPSTVKLKTINKAMKV